MIFDAFMCSGGCMSLEEVRLKQQQEMMQAKRKHKPVRYSITIYIILFVLVLCFNNTLKHSLLTYIFKQCYNDKKDSHKLCNDYIFNFFHAFKTRLANFKHIKCTH